MFNLKAPDSRSTVERPQNANNDVRLPHLTALGEELVRILQGSPSVAADIVSDLGSP